VIRRTRRDFLDVLAAEAPAVEGLDLAPGDAWSREGGFERGGCPAQDAAPAAHDYVHPLLDTGMRHCPPGRPSVEDTFRRDLPALAARCPDAVASVAQAVCIEAGDDAWTVDFARTGVPATRGDAGAPYAVRLPREDWLDLFERKTSWQALLSSDRVRVLRFAPGAPPGGLHFVYALQAVFP
jgi:hypothetical protein